MKRPLACLLIILAILFILPRPGEAASASLSIYPAAGTYALGQVFTINVAISTDVAINAASAEIAFPADKLEVISLSKTGSVLSVWPEEPSFSNSSGRITFEGIALNPGFRGNNGKLISITIRTKAVGQAALSFSSGAALANDGLGTNILSDSQGGNFRIASFVPAPSPPPPPPAFSPATDREPPAPFSVKRIDSSPRNPRPVLEFSTTDRLSGIAGYKIRIGTGDWVDAAILRQTDGSYRLPLQFPGEHTVSVRAADKAGNEMTAETVIVIEPITHPSILSYTRDVAPPQTPFAAEGTALPNSIVHLAIRNDKTTVTFSTRTDAFGKWKASYEGSIPTGQYDVVAFSEDASGARSYETHDPLSVKDWTAETANTIGRYTLIIILALLCIFSIVISGLYAHSRLKMLRLRFRREAEILNEELRKDMARLSRDVKDPSGAQYIGEDMQELQKDAEKAFKQGEE